LSTVSLARVRLHRQLIELGRVSPGKGIAMLSAFDAGQGEGVATLAIQFLEWLAIESSGLIDLSAADEDEALSQIVIDDLMRSVAVAVHAFAGTKYQAGRLGSASENPDLILVAIRRAERRYRDLLLDTRVAAETGAAPLLHDVLLTSLETVTVDIGYITQALGGHEDAAKVGKLAAVRVGLISRRYAMLCAACLHLLYRLTNARKTTGLRQVAEGRTQLARNAREMRAALTAVQGAAVGDTIRLSARCDAIAWVDDGDGHTLITVSAGELTELRLARRNAMRAGVAEGSWLYVKGALREEGGARFLEIDLLPTTTHAADIWEDYLVTQVRPAYDLAPRSIDMGWEFPDLRKIGARNDLHGRL